MNSFKTRAIVLSILKYSETQLIVHSLTRESGRQSYITYASRRNGSRRCLFQPLQILEFQTTKPRHGTMPRLSDAEVQCPLLSISTDPRKSAIAMFLGEILYRMVLEPLDDSDMYDFVENSIKMLESMEYGTANFHIWFLVKFASFMGWAIPDGYAENSWFDIKNGIYCEFPPPHPLRISPSLAGIINDVKQVPVDRLSELELSREQRRNLLDALTEYYRYHSDSFREMNSVSIFKEIF